ncbi:hypothetical protein [Aeromicrobium sp. NPDC092404]|uniref:hypothetical protein n=1 Tax=Aeromicrobium sp. NPDC092404 TaxID=3154976 RepID=UPI0034162371
MTRHLRLLAALVAAFALAAAGLVTTSAQAAVAVSVSGRVVDSDGVGVRGLTLEAHIGDGEDEDDYAYLGSTRTGGTFSTTAYGDLRPGTWTLTVSDDDDNPEYATTSKQITLVAGANALGDIVVQPTSYAEGSVTAPSGRKLKNVSVLALPGDGTFPDEEDPTFFENIGFAETDETGGFRMAGLGVGPYTAFPIFEYDVAPSGRRASFIVETAGQTVTGVNLTKIKVYPSTVHIAGTSPAKGKATLNLKVSALYYGITNPGGRFDLYLGTKKIRSAVGFTAGKRTVNLTGLGKGKRTFRFKYLGSTDTRQKWSNKITVTIK